MNIRKIHFKSRIAERYEKLRVVLYVFVFCSGPVCTLGADRFRLDIDPSTQALEWDSASGMTYKVEWKDQLVADNWTSLLNVTGTGSRLTLMDPSSTWTSRFYRMGITTPPEELMVAAASGAVRYLQVVLDADPARYGWPSS